MTANFCLRRFATAAAMTLTLCWVAAPAIAQATKPGATTKGAKTRPATSRPAGDKVQKPPVSRPPIARPATKQKTDPRAVAVIDKYLQAIGGKETLKSINDRKSVFVNKKFSPTDVVEMKMVRFLKRPIMIREEWELPGMGLMAGNKNLTFLQVYNGESAWVKTMGQVSPLTGRTLTVFVWDKPIDDHFMNWFEDGYLLTLMEESTVDGVPVAVVQTTSFAGGQKMLYFFAKDSGLLLKKQWSEAGLKGQMRKEVYFEEYQKIRLADDKTKWIKFPLTQKIFEDGELGLEKEYSNIELNKGLDNKIFGRPDGPRFEKKGLADKGAASKPKGTTQPSTKPKGASSKPSSKPASRPGR